MRHAGVLQQCLPSAAMGTRAVYRLVGTPVAWRTTPHLADGAQHAHALGVGLRAVAVGGDRTLELRRRAARRRLRLHRSAGVR
jgi:hypothetical protein